jgi:V-type H+-transporting ATPase subunit H
LLTCNSCSPLCPQVLKRHIDWQHLASQGALTAKDCNLIIGYDKQDVASQRDTLDEFGPQLAGLFIKILASVNHIETLEYTIILIDQLFSADKSPDQLKRSTDYFLTYQRENPQVDIAAPLLQILTTSGQHNPFTFLRVQHILAILLAAQQQTHHADAASEDQKQRLTIVQFLRYLISKISTLSSSSPAPSSSSSSSSPYGSPASPTNSAASNRELMACLASLKNLLRGAPKVQELFAEQDGVRALAGLLNKEMQNAQLLYLVGFNIWLLSYHKAIAGKLKEAGVIKKLVAVVKVNVMEKVIRISFAILRNFLDHNVDAFNEDMIGHGLVPVVETLQKRKFKDPDITQDMGRIVEVLYETIRNMSTFEKYSVEVTTGALTFNNPAHKNEVFWRENITQFEAKNFALVAQLIKWADVQPPGTYSGPGAAEREESAREVACFDLGEFARFHPEGKKVVAKLKGKEVLMKNLQDKSPKVQKAALLATQKLMVASWEFLNKSSSGGVASLVSQGAKKN